MAINTPLVSKKELAIALNKSPRTISRWFREFKENNPELEEPRSKDLPRSYVIEFLKYFHINENEVTIPMTNPGTANNDEGPS